MNKAGTCDKIVVTDDTKVNVLTQEIEVELLDQIEKHRAWDIMTPAQKKKQLFLNQKELLVTFLARSAIFQAQYNKSMGDLREKMVFPDEQPYSA